MYEGQTAVHSIGYEPSHGMAGPSFNQYSLTIYDYGFKPLMAPTISSLHST